MPSASKPLRDKDARLFYAPDAAEHFASAGGQAFSIRLSEEESRHALKTLRLAAGDAVRLFDGQGFFYQGIIESVQRAKAAAVRIASRIASTAEPRSRLILMTAALKGRKADWLAQKVVELGVGELRFFQARRSVPRWNETNAPDDAPSSPLAPAHQLRWEKIVVEACKQCGRARLMPVLAFPSLETALASLPETPHRYVFWEGERKPADKENAPPSSPDHAAPASSSADTILAMIGPEGGFAPEEIEQARHAGFQTRGLGPRILRAETAALAAAVILLREAGEIG